MRQLSSIKNNGFTTKLYDIIIADNDNVLKAKNIYLIMDYAQNDMNFMMDNPPKDKN
jgi:hypothetical protein